MPSRKIKLVVPTGRMQADVLALLADAGVVIHASGSNYRPAVNNPAFEVKLLKAANIPKLIEYGAHDVGFSGVDWVRESQAEVETLLDTGLLPVRIVAAAPKGVDPFQNASNRPVVAASEYERLTTQYVSARCTDWRYVRTFGATEVFPPEDADLIVDNTATGTALAANGLDILDVLLESTTLFLGNRRSLEDPAVRGAIDTLVLLMRSVIDARNRVLLEMNVAAENLDTVARLLPAMKSPTVQPLLGNRSYAIKAAVHKDRVPALIPALRAAGASDILQTAIQRVIP